MILNFDNYFDWLMKWEGTVYENDPDDPGGATKYGIDQRSHPFVKIRDLSRQGAKAIYLAEYWLPVGADKLPARTAWALTDCGVNCGRITAIRWLQYVLDVKMDGRMGPITLKAAKGRNDTELAKALLDVRAGHYRNLGARPRFRKFLRGWLNRNNDLIATLS